MTDRTTVDAVASATQNNGSLGDVPLPKRNGSKGLMPTSWISRAVKVDYRNADGRAQSLSGKLLDLYPTGIVLSSDGARVLLSWDSLVLCELVD